MFFTFTDKDVLQSSPNHNLTFVEDEDNYERKKRNHKNSSEQNSSKRSKRFFGIYDMVEKALMESSTDSGNAYHETSTPAHSDYDLDININSKPKISENLDNIDQVLEGGSHETQQYEDSLDVNPDEVKEQMLTAKEEALPQIESSVVNHADKKPFRNYPAYEKSRLSNQFAKHSYLQGSTFDNKISDSSLENVGNYKKYDDIDSETMKEDNEIATVESGVILNIDKIPGPRRVSAEENISMLISTCKTDFECSGAATCFRNSLKQNGFCKCLSGFYGVGIFCRDGTWLSKGDYGSEGIPNSED